MGPASFPPPPLLLLFSLLVAVVSAQTDASALLELKASDLNGLLSSWTQLNSTSHCSWSFVTCNPQSHVVALNIIRASATCPDRARLPFYSLGTARRSCGGPRSLSGKLPSSIVKLAELKVLALPFNDFVGEIPTAIWGLSSLEVGVTSCCTTISKRPRKRKTLTELREEECDLLKERRSLKKELHCLLLNVEKQRATNESLKKLKLQQIKMEVASSSNPNEGIWSQPEQVYAASELTRVSDLGTSQNPCQSSIPNMFHEVGNFREAAFPLPYLNLPFEENHNTEVLSGIS